jgi:hypothetical protein
VTADREHVAMMHGALEDCGRADAAVADEQHRAVLVAAADQLEEQVRGTGLKRQITELELWLAKVRRCASRSLSLPSARPLAARVTTVVASTDCSEYPGGGECAHVHRKVRARKLESSLPLLASGSAHLQ